jgi:small subunit ribosomal protein S6
MALRHYETVFIVTPVLSDQQIKETVEKYRSWLLEHGAQIDNDEHWGLKKLAYPINHKTTGVYQLYEFTAEPALIEKLETEYKRDELIMRFLCVSLDKYGVEYNAKRRKQGKSKSDQENKSEEVQA